MVSNLQPIIIMGQISKLPFSQRELERLIKTAAIDSANVFFSDHASSRLNERDISTVDVLDCLRNGAISEGPAKSPRGNWQFVSTRFCAGRSINVVGALELDEETGNYIVVITAYRG